MRLWDTLGLHPDREPVVAITGAGGKTTLLYALAREAARAGKRTAVTTTTHILRPEQADHLSIFLWGAASVSTPEPMPGIAVPVFHGRTEPLCAPDDEFDRLEGALSAGKIVVAGTVARDHKLSSPPTTVMDWLFKHTDVLLIEADGSKRLPIKFPNKTEPVLPAQIKRTVTVAGLSALGKPFGEVCHRAEIACDQLGILPEQAVTPKIVAELLLHGYACYHPVIVLNQADSPALKAQAGEVAAYLQAGGLSKTVIVSLQQEEFKC